MDSPVEEYDSPVSAGGSDDSGNANYDDFPEIGVFTIPTEPFFEEPEEENDGFTQISQRLSQFIFQEPRPVDMVLKLARHFRWKVIYILHDEKGPAHHKTFSVKMTITFPTTPALQFFAEGTTIKKSKHAASMKAITDLFERDIINDEILRSVYQENSKSELDKVLKTHYPSLLPINYSVIALPDWSGCSYSATINRAGFAYVTGYGRTKREAKNQAALLFLNEIRPYQDHGQTFHYEKSCRKWPNNASKHLEKSSSCSVSILNELSLKSKKEVYYECVSREGADHNPKFSVRCCYGDIVAFGCGSSKKEAKKDAAVAVLKDINHEVCNSEASENIDPKPEVPTMNQDLINTNNKSKKRNNMKKFKLNPDYGQNIHPVARLYQIQQAQEQSEPDFCVRRLPEAETTDGDFFKAEVCLKCGTSASATGRNMKLAKRHAAEAMLRKLGYSILPVKAKPGKSLLKTVSSYEYVEEDAVKDSEDNKNEADEKPVTPDELSNDSGSKVKRRVQFSETNELKVYNVHRQFWC